MSSCHRANPPASRARLFRSRRRIAQETAEPLVPLLLRCLFDTRRSRPHVSSWVDEPGDSITPRLIGRRHQYLRAAGDGPLHRVIDVLDVHVQGNWSATVGRWRTIGGLRPFAFDHQHGSANRDESVGKRSVRTRSPDTFFGFKRRDTKFNFIGGTATEKSRDDGRRARWDTFSRFIHRDLHTNSDDSTRIAPATYVYRSEARPYASNRCSTLAALPRHVREDGWRMAVFGAPVIRGLGGRAGVGMTVSQKRLVIVGATGVVGGYDDRQHSAVAFIAVDRSIPVERRR